MDIPTISLGGVMAFGAFAVFCGIIYEFIIRPRRSRRRR